MTSISETLCTMTVLVHQLSPCDGEMQNLEKFFHHCHLKLHVYTLTFDCDPIKST